MIFATSTRQRIRMLACGIAGAVALTTATACSFGPNDLPSVRRGVDVDFEVTLKFASVMNLPTGADVVMNGIRIGEVESLQSTDRAVDVRVGLAADARVPVNSSAVIRQNTLLGDTYIALSPPADSAGSRGGFLEEGDVVPVDRTTSPPQLEDTIAVLAHFVNGGSIQKAQETMAVLNDTVADTDNLRALASTVAIDLEDLAGQTADIDGFLNGVDNTAVSIRDRRTEWQAVFSPGGAEYWDKVANQSIAHISTLLPSLGSIFSGGLWLVPMLNSLADASESFGGNANGALDTSNRVTNFLESTLLPFVNNPSVNVTSVTTSSGVELIGDAENVLRMLGAVR